METCNIVQMEAELSPGAIEQWISTVKNGKMIEKGKRRSDLAIKVRRHLSALGWVISYFNKGNKREMRYKSPKGRWFYSLAKACMSCVDQDSQQQQQQIVPKYDLSCSPRNLSSESSFDVSNQKQKKNKKRSRVEDLDISSTAPEKESHPSDELIKIVPNFDVSKQQQKKIMNRVEGCDMAALNEDQEKIRIVLNVDVLNQQQKKRRKTASEEIRRPKIEKSLKKVLQVMEKKQQKNKHEKESLRFCRKDCSPDMNCDVCCVCHWGGDLLLCDGCPSAFHHTCLGLSSLPEEDLWFCPCCCCDICGSMDSPANSKLMACEQCQRRFHLKCLKEEPCNVSSRGWFCSSQCNRVSSALQNLIGCKIAVGDNGDLVWTLMRAPNEGEHYDDEQISKLESAVEILHQGFEPTKDVFSGRDLVEELIFRKDRTGVGRGFYTVLIERKNEPITVAAVRVDKDVVEIPLVATLSNYRRSGMCRVLMDELEKQMSQMGVCRLVLPAAKEVVTTWTQRFGFSVMESSERLELVKHGMLDFVGTVMCHKFLVKERAENDSAEESSLTE
ncbi:Zinc finger FYVE/PHD-type [Arabidopsis thaliana x Arabidopsis arenosa]|uniref:Zinc finger FYVE/PHD-type n=1 Tax=Arabidopsis thaliana x Arabidopsis arenosa TaxID=1240361 RepID=A0A8T1XWF3_9BRAS|nr:Zinc finger FYVE/PHD-type [Arabidopsis thaliana x Arabidopsis arenosa]